MNPSTEPFNENKYKALMDGLECCEIYYHTICGLKNKRIDNEFFLKSYIQNEYKLKQFGYKKIDDIILRITDFGAYSQTNIIELLDNGVNFFRNQDVKNDSVDIDECAKISNEVYNKLSLKLEVNDILIPRTGSLGNACVVSEEHLPASANQNLAVLRGIQEMAPHFISLILCSKVGILQINRMSTGNVQQWLNLDAIKELKIPHASKLLQEAIQKVMLMRNQFLNKSKKLYYQAEQHLISILDIVNRNSTEKSISVKSFSESFSETGRLDAEYYQPKYDEYEHIILKCLGGFVKIREKFEPIKTKCLRDLKEYHYVEIGDIDVGNGSTTFNVVTTENLPDNAKIMTREGDIIVSTVRPNRGAVSIIEDDNLLVSGAFTVLRQNNDYPKEVLQVLLRTEIYRDWLLKYNVGTSYPVIKDDDVLNMPIPLFDINTQKQVVLMVQEAHKLRRRAEQLLEYAKQAVEIAIDQSEEKAMEWLQEKGVEV